MEFKYMDKVKCLYCEKESFVERESNKCENCKTDGHLIDVEQDVFCADYGNGTVMKIE